MYVLELAGTDDAFAGYEAASAVSGLSVIGGGLATAREVTTRVDQLALTHRLSELVATTAPAIEAARTALRSAPIHRSGSVAVRARDVRGGTGVDTQAAERELGSVLVDQGCRVDLEAPEHELRAVFAGAPSVAAHDAVPIQARSSDGVCALGWLQREPERGFTTRAPTDRPFFQPGSMDPSLARALVNIAGARQDARLLDPMCGTGGLLIEGAVVGAEVVGTDVLPKMVSGTRENLRTVTDAVANVCRADARRLPVATDTVDAVVFDAPYGRQTAIESDTLEGLLAGALAEAHRVAPRAVVVGDRPWDDVATDAGWTVDARFQRRVHRSLDRYVHVLARAD